MNKKELTVNCLKASLEGASRVGKLAFNTGKKVWVLSRADPAPIDDGWEVISDDEGKDESQPGKSSRVMGREEESISAENMDVELVRRFRAAETELRSAIALMDKTIEAAARRKLSDCRRDIAAWEKARAASPGWTTEPTFGGSSFLGPTTQRRPSPGGMEDAEDAISMSPPETTGPGPRQEVLPAVPVRDLTPVIEKEVSKLRHVKNEKPQALPVTDDAPKVEKPTHNESAQPPAPVQPQETPTPPSKNEM